MFWEMFRSQSAHRGPSAGLASARRRVQWLFVALLLAAGSAMADEPAVPAIYTSAHFHLQTDLARDEALSLLGRMESLLTALETFWGQRARGQADCRVVRDLDRWPDGLLSEDARKKVAAGVGLTDVEAVWRGAEFVRARVNLYATAAGDTPLHETVHAYFALAFGRPGPVWFAEGLAEEGRFWRPGRHGVHAPDHVIRHLRGHAPPPLDDVLSADAATGDDWQAYSTRWALCHLLVHHPAYSRDFRRLGLSMLGGKEKTFDDVFGDRRRRIEFEYAQFLVHIATGYRVDLCAWQWDAEFTPLADGDSRTARVLARGGWQPSGAIVRANQLYACRAAGQWRISERLEGDADGGASGRGRLLGVVFHDDCLSEPFELGTSIAFTPPVDGQLWLRCGDDWGALADNSGEITATLSVRSPPHVENGQ